MFRSCGVGSYRRGQPLGSNADTYTYSKSDSDSQD
jgi:serine-aspartate repeat-containing protein C/D/E